MREEGTVSFQRLPIAPVKISMWHAVNQFVELPTEPLSIVPRLFDHVGTSEKPNRRIAVKRLGKSQWFLPTCFGTSKIVWSAISVLNSSEQVHDFFKADNLRRLKHIWLWIRNRIESFHQVTILPILGGKQAVGSF